MSIEKKLQSFTFKKEGGGGGGKFLLEKIEINGKKLRFNNIVYLKVFPVKRYSGTIQ